MTSGKDRGRAGNPIRRAVELGLLGLLATALTATVADWLIWEARGTPQSSIEVTRMVVAPLKGNREEYYPDGTETLRCSRSILPWNGLNACWWLERHHIVLER